jgi:hypothetical protein
MIDALPLLLGPEGYQISRSVRLRSSASAYFNRTPGSAGNQKTWTWSGWFKTSTAATDNTFLDAYVDASNETVFRTGGNQIIFNVWDTAVYRISCLSTAVFRDPSAYYHVLLAVDTTQATNSNGVKLYVNGEQVALSFTAYTQNVNCRVNATVSHRIGLNRIAGSDRYTDGYLTEINFIDGQALTPSSFGETNQGTGVWQPKKYAGTYGTNGFFLNFSDNTGATATTIGADYSGNGNNWTPNNISVTAGATYDSMLDVPTQWADGGNGRGNYCVLNPLKKYTANFAFSNGNLAVSDAGSSVCMAAATMRTPTTGKWYWEITATTISGSLGYIAATSESVADASSGSGVASYRSNGAITNQSGAAQTSGASYTSGDVIGVAVDVDAGTVQFYKNNVAQGATPSFSFTAGTVIVPAVVADNAAGTKTFDANFGQRPFAYTPPTGFKALNTLNLPTPTILKGNQYFDATTYTGTGASLNVVNSGGMQPDFVWTKPRSTAVGHTLFDSLRGVTKYLQSNTTGAEGTAATSLTAFNSDGFTVNSDTSTGANGVTYVGWQWKEGPTQGFDIVTYTGTLTTSGTVAINHNLGVAPKLVISKSRNNAGVDSGAWFVWSASLSTDSYLRLNTTAAAASVSGGGGGTMIAPTSTQFYTPYISGANINANNYVAYLFSEVAGFSKFGSYTGNGSADGPFVFCGFRPAFVMWKNASASEAWLIEDTARSTFNQVALELYPSSSGAEAAGSSRSPTQQFDFLSNGFKVRGAQGQTNGSGNTIIFAAFSESPFKNALAR